MFKDLERMAKPILDEYETMEFEDVVGVTILD
jgi:hypothetical protein